MRKRTHLKTVTTPTERVRQLNAELQDAQRDLQEAERVLAEEQAAVNAFRMHCRITIGHWVDTLIELRGEKEGLVTQKRLLQQELGIEERGGEEREGEGARSDGARGEESVDSLTGAILEEMIDAEAQREAEKSLYRDLARRFHPDLAANNVEKAYRTSIMAAVNVAYQQHDVQTLRDLAGEIDPEVIAEIEQIDSVKVRKLRERIVRCQRYKRKVEQQHRALRQENTAKLWLKAQELDVTGDSDWWQEIKQSLAVDVETLEGEIAALTRQVAALEQLAKQLEETED